MPVAAAIAIRYVIMAAVQLAIWWAIEKFGLPLINKAVQDIMVKFGVDEQTAKDIMANKLILAFEEVGIFAATLRTKLPIKVAEYLGFTTKGYGLRKISQAVEAKVGTSAISATTKAAATAAEIETVATVVSKSRILNVGTVKTLLNYIFKYAGLTTGIFFAAAQYIDFANWQGPYQKFFQGVLANFGINPDTALPKANTISADNWKRLYSTIEELKPLGISYPFSGVDKAYSRENLASLVDEVAANLQKSGVNPTYKNVIAIVLPLIQLSTATRTDADIDKIISKYAVAPANASTGGYSAPTTKVFTGIVSQGVVGKGLVFESRPDDLIESLAELRTAAANNLAPFLQAIFGKIVYEVKVVASVITKDGFKQTGQSQRIKTGTYANGTPKYKTVTNKFATLTVYALTDKGSRAKLTTIVLGPTDSAKLTVGQNELRELELKLKDEVTTTDIEEITEIVTPAGTVSVPKQEYTVTYVKPGGGYGGNSVKIDGIQYSLEEVMKDAVLSARYMYLADDPNGVMIAGLEKALKEGISKGTSKADQEALKKQIAEAKEAQDKYGAAAKLPVKNMWTDPALATVPGVTSAAPVGLKNPGNASTLYEWYQAQGRSVPSVAERAKIYEGMGLGQASFYTGTSEQNTKLLSALKSGAIAPASTAPTYEGYIDNGALGVR